MFKLIFAAVAVVTVSALSYVGYGMLSKQSLTSSRSATTSNKTVSDSSGVVVIEDLIPANKAEQAPQLKQGDWINSEPLSLDKLKGRVVFVDFWTFGCYNCRNTLPALKKFDERYREQGLTIIGVHTPEFDHEKDAKNVQSNVNKLGIKYPVVTDNNFDTWNAYGVRAWPSIFILDKQGRIRYTHIGEGRYDEQEQVIKTLLAEK
jgi:thiol-disulfide isomerase/thioredoxin